MSKHLAVALVAAGIACSALAQDSVTIDAQSEESAQRTYEQMFQRLPEGKRMELQMAILQLNMDGVGSASEMLADPELRNPGIKRIRARVAGMSADQIIAESKKVTSVRLVVPKQ